MKKIKPIKINKKFQNRSYWLAFALLILSSIPALVYYQLTEAAISSYNFAGITNPSATHIARSFEVDVGFPTNGALTIDTLTDDGLPTGTPQLRTGIIGYALDSEALNSQYTAISTSNDSHWTTNDPGFGDTQAFWAQFDIAETPANITQIDISVEGYQGGSPQAGRKAWLGIWVPDAPTPYWKTLEAAQKTADYTYSGTLTSNLEDYIDGTGKLNIILYNEDQNDPLLIDYVNVDVTFSIAVAPPAILTAAINDPDNGDRSLSAGDTLTLTFDKATNAPAAATKAEIDGLIDFPTSLDLGSASYDHIIGADYTGTWSTTTFANDTLTITVVNGIVVLASNQVELKAGDTITLIADGTADLKDSTEASNASTSAKVVTGNWGLRPDDDVTYASDHNNAAQVFEVTLVDQYHYNHAAPYLDRGDLTYVGLLPHATYAIGRRPSDGFIFAGENDVTGTPGALKLMWMNPEKKPSAGQSADGYDPSTLGNPFARGVLGTLGPTVAEFYRLVYTASGVLYGASNDNKFYRVYDSIQAVPAGNHGSSTNLAGAPICTIAADAGDPVGLQLATGGSADFAFDSNGKLYMISHDILYWIETGPLVSGVITGPCTAHAIGDTGISEVSGLALTKGGQMHISSFLPTNRKLTTVDQDNATTSNQVNFDPDQDIYDLGSVPKWTDIEIVKSDGGVEFKPGTAGSYTLTITNAAAAGDPTLSDASGPIIVQDTLPTGLTFVSASGTDWVCDNVGQLIECINPNGIPKETALPVITVNVNVQDNAVNPNPPYEAPEPLLLNTACVDSTTFEEFDVQDCDTEPTPVGLPELTLSKTPSDTLVNPGQTGLIYTLRLRNTRTITGTGISISDPINDPPLNAYLENLNTITTTNCGHLAETTIKIKGTELKSGENPASANLIIDGTSIAVDIPDGATNATIASTITTAINTDGTHQAVADGSVVTIYHGTGSTASNGKVVDTSALVTVINTADVTDDDTELPAPAFAYATDPTNNSTATKIQIDNVAVGPYSRTAQECVVTYTVDIKNGVAGGTIIHNQADATAPTEGGGAVSATADVTVSNAPILSPVKVDDDVDDVVLPSQTVTYTLTIDNIGNLDGTTIDIDDTLDTDLENLSVTSLTNCGTYTDNSTANPAVLNIDDVDITMANDCVVIFTADVKAATLAGSTIPNTVFVSAAAEGGFPTQSSSDVLVVGGAPSLDGTKVHDKGGKAPPNEVDPGELVTYTLTIDNLGTVDGTGINIDDTLDTNFEDLNVVSLTNCGVYTDNSTANPPVLNVDGVDITSALNCVIVFEVTVKNPTPPGTTIPNTASASAAIEGGTGDPNIPAVDLQVPGTIAITTSKADNDADDIVDPGQTVTYTVSLQNTGDVKLTGIQVLDTLDSDLENLNVVSLTNCGTNYLDQSNANPPELDIRGLGGDPNKGIDIISGQTCSIVFTADVKAGTAGGALIPNVATVTASQEGSPGSTPASDVLTVSMPVIGITKADDDVDDVVSRGQTVTYTVTIANTGNGNRPAIGVDLYDAMDTDLENLTVTNLTNCGGTYTDNSAATPAVLDIDDVDIANGVNCVVTFTADVKNTTPGGSTIPNTILMSDSDEGATGGAAISDVLTVPIVCGDGLLEAPEQCDDSNLIDGDGCESTCTLTFVPPTSTCGNGIIEGAEQCDDGNAVEGDGCSTSCRIDLPVCRGCTPPAPPPSPPVKTCFEHDPRRGLYFNDVNPSTEVAQYIITLKDTKIRAKGDYVLSGNDNHSTGKQQQKFAAGNWEYQPDRFVRRIEAVKAILVSNCIPIENKIPIPDDGFRYRDIPVDIDESNELMHFAARVFYTGYKWGIVTANEEGLAYPFKDVNMAEVIAIGLRTSRALTKEYTKIKNPWYGKYLTYAKEKGILYGISKDPNAKLLRDDFAKIIFRIMWHNPRSKVYKYAQQFKFMVEWNRLWEKVKDTVSDIEDIRQKEKEKKTDITQVEKTDKILTDIQDLASEAESGLKLAAPDSCLMHQAGRLLKFIDVPKAHWAYPYITALRTTAIKNSGDFIISGHGNPSTGTTDTKYHTGDWEFRPYENVSFFELVKVALVSNCIPIDKVIIPPEDNFAFRQLPRNLSPRDDELKYFAARVMYTAYKNGLLKGDVFPFIPVSRLQAISILSRASDILPNGYVPKPLPFSDTSDNTWYSPYLSYLVEQGLIKGFADGTFRGGENLKRDELAKFVTVFMQFNKNPDIQKFSQYLNSYYDIKP